MVDGSGCVLTPGLVNTHNHLYQWATRGLAVDDSLFGWLTSLYPVWGGIDAEVVNIAAQGALAWLARTGCTTTADHHYVFPLGAGDVFESEVAAARSVGLRFHPARGSMDLGQSDGGLPPDHVVEDRDTILSATEEVIDRWHDPAPDSMLRVAVAPCSPFSVTGGLMRDSAALARRRGVRMHTHLAETTDEQEFCRGRFGCPPLEYAESLGWTGEDVWYAHGIHFSAAEVTKMGASRTGVAHCPSSNARLGAGVARGSPVGLGVDGAASNEAGRLLEEVRQAVSSRALCTGPVRWRCGARWRWRLSEEPPCSAAARTSVPSRSASSRIWRCGDWTRWPTPGSPTPSPHWCSAPHRRWSCSSSTGARWWERDRIVTVDESTLTTQVGAAHTKLLRKGG